MGGNRQQTTNKRRGEVQEWDATPAVSRHLLRRRSCVRAGPRRERDDETNARRLPSVLAVHLLRPNTAVVPPHCLLLQHSLRLAGLTLWTLLFHPHLLHVLRLPGLRPGIQRASSGQADKPKLLLIFIDSHRRGSGR